MRYCMCSIIKKNRLKQVPASSLSFWKNHERVYIEAYNSVFFFKVPSRSLRSQNAQKDRTLPQKGCMQNFLGRFFKGFMKNSTPEGFQKRSRVELLNKPELDVLKDPLRNPSSKSVMSQNQKIEGFPLRNDSKQIP